MPASIEDLFVHNRAWAARMERERPGFFTSLLAQQKPGYMWIGCSDSRVPANQITGLEPGEVFVHRNVANVVVPSDLNCLSTIQYAVDQLHIEHIMVVGHYGCGGVRAALDGARIGLADNWIRHVQDVRDRHRGLIASIAPEWRYDVLCELNAIEQVLNLAQTTVVRDAWERGQKVWLHGWCYGLKDGLINDLRMTVDGAEGLDALHRAAIAGVAAAKR
ncbi:carbonate dehydratase [Verminephrobacter aporrectodeae]|uniref:Carbonic anhydrase n=1 Tax=Verminephrobacter aporrectodeae subsp. tuberculatae TaxID=1110392 RepID=A0ABT3KUK1_9BURK|nr:carbonate dehydratase [Verminephrobacter aporrectodeae]MCW5256806.1 carbonate dehydratase [Verminephrobacter aporrectodeae subsp. tuberculatae]MCW5322023.1 carbonate dehydratase [Verminephrobacter aporrectodeae subsp. tuberculatae]MCW8164385.1 carbonate dehydratase [Verminephrobacter aporrectodeae subsp. tuberculatae]MCW8170334.1 carbonate dehydratase [Verminephrobacter aporrectodeae subsp. tuberculatae]MCW8174288.1 carbonate dehydratase [Verminephrobacter aporrectodeae subsp. tuberculatae]